MVCKSNVYIKFNINISTRKRRTEIGKYNISKLCVAKHHACSKC